MFLMKTCMVGSGSIEEEREVMEDSEDSDVTLLERIMDRLILRRCDAGSRRLIWEYERGVKKPKILDGLVSRV